VTLLTGDTVGARTVPGGPPLVTVRPGRGRQRVIFSTYVSSGERIEVVPRDVAPLVGSMLDPALFDITTSILNGDDDAHRLSIPLIVQGGRGSGAAAAATRLAPSARASQTPESIGAVAVSVSKANASAQGKALAAMASALGRARRGSVLAVTGIGHVWLDRTTPEVAGAAAILAQVHPGWSPAEIRADLVSTAHAASGGDTDELGGGRLDIAAAVSDPVVATTGVADLGTVSPLARPVDYQLSWRPAAVSLDLSATLTGHSGHPAPIPAAAASTRPSSVPTTPEPA
jgi:hypothetical protein